MAFENDQEDILHDVRLVRHHIRRGLLDRGDHKQYLEGLGDDAEAGVETVTRFAQIWSDPDEDAQS